MSPTERQRVLIEDLLSRHNLEEHIALDDAGIDKNRVDELEIYEASDLIEYLSERELER